MDKLNKIHNAILKGLTLTDESRKYAILSDLHLGVGDSRDNALKNALMIFEALKFYYENNYVVIMLGDTFELAENKSIRDIECVHENIMWVLGEIYKLGNLVIVRGNHDSVLTTEMLKTRPFSYTKSITDFLPGISIYESVKLILPTQTYVMMHGQQVIFRYCHFNSLINFGIRHFWSPLEKWLLKEPTSETDGFEDHNEVDVPFTEYAEKNNVVCICGHTHSVVINPGKYYNIGGGVMPRSITCIEIDKFEINSYKWAIENTSDKGLIIKKSKLG